MTLEAASQAFYDAQKATGASARRAAREVWEGLDQDALADSWRESRAGERLFVAVATAQLSAASRGAEFASRAVEQQGVAPDFDGNVDAAALAGIGSDGRDLEQLLTSPLVESLAKVGEGVPAEQAARMGQSKLDTIVETQVADAGRIATQVGMTAERHTGSYIRLLTPPSCGRCALLAGVEYRYSTGFLRHPRCDCQMIPSIDYDDTEPIRTDPQAYFESLSAEDQDKYFTKAGAEAIRLGADMNQVVNARRGAAGLARPGRFTEEEQTKLRGGRSRGRLERVDIYGRKLYITSEGTTVRGTAGQILMERSGTTELRTAEEREADRAKGDRSRKYRRARTPRLMPESILELAGDDKQEAVRLLKRFGYLYD